MSTKPLPILIITLLILSSLPLPVLAGSSSSSGGGSSNPLIGIIEQIKTLTTGSVFGKLSSANILYNNIPVSIIELCKVVPTESWDRSTPMPVNGCGTYQFDLKNYPANNLPSGGFTTPTIRLSPSEMVAVKLKISNYPGSGTIKMTWANKDTNTVIADIPEFSVPACGGNCAWSWWWYESYSNVGRFDWEINRPGNYYVVVDAYLPNSQTLYGRSKIEFTVVDTSPTVTPPPIPHPISSKDLSILSDPQGANVYVGANLMGTTPFILNVLGDMTITYKLTGYHDQTRTVGITTSSPVSVTMSPLSVPTPTPPPQPIPTIPIPSPSPSPTVSIPQPSPSPTPIITPYNGCPDGYIQQGNVCIQPPSTPITDQPIFLLVLLVGIGSVSIFVINNLNKNKKR